MAKASKSALGGQSEQVQQSPQRIHPSSFTRAPTDSTSPINTMFNPGASHLEKMGRELKCPICLSLLKKTASLTCNHVFCNECILKSMKSGPGCPVCKVPFARREIRLAPHMDTLVNIYRNMEMASGINLFVSQPSPSLVTDFSDGQDKENKSPCQNDLKRKSLMQPGRKTKKAKGRGHSNHGQKPSRLSSVSFGGLRENKGAENIEQKSPDQAIPSPHQPVKRSFPTKKRVQVSLYPPGSYETPPRPGKRVSNSENSIIQNEDDGINEYILPRNSDKIHIDSESRMRFGAEAKAGSPLKSKQSVPPTDRILLDDFGNPVLAPFFWLRDRDSQEADGALLPTSQPTQTSPLRPSFSDLKDSDDEGWHQQLQSDEVNIGIRVPDTFDSEMFEWTQMPCSPELNSSPIKQQSQKLSEVVVSPCKGLQNDDALLTNDLNKGPNEMDQVNDAEFAKYNTAEDAFASPIPCTNRSVDELADTHILEIKQASNKACKTNLTNLIIEPEDVLEKISLEESGPTKKSGNAWHGRKSHRKMRPKSTGGTNNLKRACKRETQRKSKPKSDQILTQEMLSPVSDSVVGCESSKLNPKDAGKELVFTATDIFNAMFGLPTDKTATNNSVEVKSQIDTELIDRQHLYPVGLQKTVQNGGMTDSPVNLTPKHQHDVQTINNGGSLEPTTQAGFSEMHPQTPGNCCRTEPSTSKHGFFCAFCRISGNSETAGRMMHYSNGSSVREEKEMPSNVIHVHKTCAEWAPDVYFKDDCVMNLEAEVARGTKIKCTTCGLKGAALGCCFTKCRRSFHVPCALSTPECRWDVDNFVMLCPAHSSRKFPNERRSSTSSKHSSSLPRRGQQSANKGTLLRGDKSPGRQQADEGSKVSQSWTWPLGQQCKWILCGSALDPAQKEQLNNFVRLTGATISKTWSPAVTHVVASTDADGACRRTLKFLMSILEGKWVLKIDWIAACMEAGHPVNEEPFEITHDIHGTFEGPKRGRARVEKKAPKLFEGLRFYLSGDFAASSKGYLQELASAAGGLVLHRKPILDQPECQSTIVLYNVELPETSKFSGKDKIVQNRLKEARSLADATGAQYAAHTWILESIAACQLQPMGNGCS